MRCSRWPFMGSLVLQALYEPAFFVFDREEGQVFTGPASPEVQWPCCVQAIPMSWSSPSINSAFLSTSWTC
jgi:hypothetical protein